MSYTLTVPSIVTGALQFNNDSLTNVQNTAVGTWITASATSTNAWAFMAYSPELSRFCAVSSDGTNRVMYSSDGGITWSTVGTVVPQANSWKGICWSPELSIFVAVSGTGANRAMYSSDGITWATSNLTTAYAWFRIAWSPQLGLFCAISTDNSSTARSPDGITWIVSSSPKNSLLDICWSPELSLFCIVNLDGFVLTSPDGFTWTTAGTTPPTKDLRGVCWSPELNLFCAVSITGSGSNNVWTSSDGDTWVSRTTNNNQWIAVTWASEISLFCAVSITGSGNRLMTSPDGATWTTRSTPTSPDETDYIAVSWSGSLTRLVALGNIGTNRVLYSNNDFSSYIETTSLETQAITDVSVIGKNVNIGESSNVVNIGKYASELTLGSPGTRITSMGNFMGISTLWDEKAASTSGGNSLAGAWYIRFLNNIRNYGQIDCVLTPGTFTASSPASTTSYFTLGTGTYFIWANSPSMRANQMQIRLQNTTASKTLCLGSSGYSQLASNIGSNNHSLIENIFEIINGEEDDSLSIQFRSINTASTWGYGWGGSNGWGNTVFTQVLIYKLY